jgi:cyclic pyranopterin phosphate synthase
VRKNIMHLVCSIGRHIEIADLDELTLTINGSQLSRHAQDL